ncbi:MAG: shikimate dehydrogenase [Nitrospinota bacterium]|nr:shikimate dehydrogenase [Nitrospinota bacterium]
MLEKCLGIFGHPLSHTMSPVMHNTSAKELGLPYKFMAFDVKPKDLEEAVLGTRGMGFSGLCITIPHKVEVFKLVDKTTKDAELIGAVNVVTFSKNGEMTGHNTDGLGWVKSLQEIGETPKGKKCLILGAGGAARAIAVKLAQEKAKHISIRNRSISKAEELAQYITSRIPGSAADGDGLQSLEKETNTFDLIVNTTSVGMSGEDTRESTSLIEESWISERNICSDAVYNPLETIFLQNAKRRGAKTLSGLGWLIHQGALAWKLWTGTEMPIVAVRKALIEELTKNEI